MTVEDILAALQAVIDGAKADDGSDRPLTEEEAQRYEDLEKQLATARQDIEIRNRQKAYMTPTRNDLGAHVAVPKHDDGLERAFESYMRTGVINADIMELRAQGEGTGSAGGFFVPAQFRNKLVERLLAFGGLASAAEVISTDGGNPLEWPTLDDTSNQGSIVGENGAPASGADLSIGQKTLGAHKYMSVGTGGDPLRVSVELLQDSAFDVQGLVARKLGERIARKQARDWILGSGVGEPEGILNKAGTEALGADTVTYDDLVAMYHDVDPEYRGNASWLFSDNTLEIIRRLVDGDSRPLWAMHNDSISTLPGGGTLLGRPVVIDQDMPDLTGSATGDKCIVFGDLRESYVIRRVRDVQLVVDPYSRASNGQVQFTAWARADGCIQNPNSYTIGTAA